ncbi:putative zinc-binding peptidase [Acinetobacter sp. MD2(2019)]|uniref:zinc-binding metallopeptidase family protein n=1 Tax=Acinetobacter sp. MD2(2019) TaxID=2605273 RepID=UPI002D1F0783|nr:putative zinc-binding peptidase [Acinetobacter sp. MD2(2019)]MEB3754760.1 putative zinc-binding metallopeptidase [Acinetobacter sp. MD2(2019)]
MNVFYCQYCQHQVFFPNTFCESCSSVLGFQLNRNTMGTFAKIDSYTWRSLDPQDQNLYYKPCYNYSHYQACNWVIPAEQANPYCESCQLTHLIPDLSDPQNLNYWKHIEAAKRRFLHLTKQLDIFPRPKKDPNDHFGLQFNFLMPYDNQPVMTGHANGVITLNASEADVVVRIKTRMSMEENYRTLLGHFRHESGHYYFELMQHFCPNWIDEFRVYFGNEQADYSQALAQYYENGPQANWSDFYVSRYACAHPWEDWAETWAHYLHMLDTLDTAYQSGLTLDGKLSIDPHIHFEAPPLLAQDFELTINNWFALTYILNALNRSMGLDDAYPFTLSNPVLDKLRFIHRSLLQIHNEGHTSSMRQGEY